MVLGPIALQAQATGTVEGRVRSLSGEPLVGVVVTIDSLDRHTRTGGDGRYRLDGVPVGRHRVQARAIGYRPVVLAVTVRDGQSAAAEFSLAEAAVVLDAVTVVTGASRPLNEVPAAVGTVGREELSRGRPAHPSEVMNQVAGVWVNVSGGEGHMAAIRQPMTTEPVYLYLENGVPTRSTGFFNHNALYEINLPLAEGVEVLKGPGTALYGSDAIGGVVNVRTRPPSVRREATLMAEAGPYGWARLLASASNTYGAHGLRADLNLTRTSGWRAGTDYNRQSATVRWDVAGPRTRVNTLLSGSRIDQATAGSSAISEADYLTNPTANYTPISARFVEALRLSVAVDHRTDGGELSVTPYARYNRMELLPNWTLTFDPQRSDSRNFSVGVLARYRHALPPLRAEAVVGIDLDLSPGSRAERALAVTRDGPVFTSYTVGALNYDYDVTYRGASPYAQVEVHPVSALRLTAGLRYDWMGYGYSNRLDVVQTGAHRRPADTTLSFAHLSPTVGATIMAAPELTVFASYRRGFRVPSEGQIFRQGRAVNTVGLAPVKADSWEAGLRGVVAGLAQYDLAAYAMTKRDDILSLTNPDGSTVTTNAGRTSHRGIEAQLSIRLPAGFLLAVAGSYARHRYQDWQPRADLSFNGREIENAPDIVGSVRARYAGPLLGGGDLTAEIMRVGRYWMDPDNTTAYPGHTLLHLRGSYVLFQRVAAYARLHNVTSARYAERASFTQARGAEFAPGMPRTLYAGLEVR
jgi:outer membrane receptor protein involved in Fe transport